MSELAKRGRLQLVLNLFALLAISALIGLSQISAGSAPPFVPIGRFGLSLLLVYFVYRGSAGARVLFVFFAGVAALVEKLDAASLAASRTLTIPFVRNFME